MIGLFHLKELMFTRVYYFSLLVSFFEISFRFQQEVCDGCHDLMQKAISFNHVAIVFVKGNHYRIHFLYMNKDEAINLLKHADLREKSRILRNIKTFLSCIKVG